MASIKAPRFLTSRQRASGAYFVWQPPSRMGKAGWKAAPLLDPSGQASPAAQAMAQAHWLNALYDTATAGDAETARALLACWTGAAPPADLALRFPDLTACPPVAYRVPGLDGQPRVIRRKSFAELEKLYRQSLFFKDLRPRTAQDYEAHLKALLPLIGDQPVAALTRKPLRKLYDALIRRHGAATATARFRVLSVALSYAVEVEWLQANPLYRFRFVALPGRIRVPAEAEVAALIEATRRMPEGPRPDAAGLIVAAAFTGHRRGDLIENFTLKAFREGRLAFATSKTASFVNVELLDELLATGATLLAEAEARFGNLDARFAALKLSNRRAWFRHMAECPFLWNLERGLPMDRYSATRLFARVRAEAARRMPGVADIQLRDFRDYMITELFRSGCTDAEVSAITGQSERSVAMRRKHYVDRHDPVITANAVEKLRRRRASLKIVS